MLHEESIIWSFVEDFNSFCSQDTNITNTYFKYLLDKLSFVNEYDDCLSRRILHFINSIILTGQIKPDNINLVLDMLFNKFRELMNMRYNLDKFSKMANFEATDEIEASTQNIFLRFGVQIISISSFLIEPTKFN